MTNLTIEESGMSFGPYPEDHCFRIEKSETYKKIQDGVKIAEFLLLRTNNGDSPDVLVVEAKSSSPKPETQPNFDEFISEIREKLLNGFSLGLAACLKRPPKTYEEIPDSFKSLDLSTASFKLVLVVKKNEESWLPPLKDALAKSLHSTIKIWALPPMSVIVLNDDLARERGLIETSSK